MADLKKSDPKNRGINVSKYKRSGTPTFSKSDEPAFKQGTEISPGMQDYWDTVHRRTKRKNFLNDNSTTLLTGLTEFRMPTDQEIEQGRSGWEGRAQLGVRAAKMGMIDAMTGKAASKILPKLTMMTSKGNRLGKVNNKTTHATVDYKKHFSDPKSRKILYSIMEGQDLKMESITKGHSDEFTKAGDDYVKNWFSNPEVRKKIGENTINEKSILENLNFLESIYLDKPFHSKDPNILGLYMNRSTPLSPENKFSFVSPELSGYKEAQTVATHEGTHFALDYDKNISKDIIDQIQSKINSKNINTKSDKILGRNMDSYLADPGEIYARVMQLREAGNVNPGKKMTEKEFDNAFEYLKKRSDSAYGIENYTKKDGLIIGGKSGLLDLVNTIPVVLGGMMLNEKNNEPMKKYATGGSMKDPKKKRPIRDFEKKYMRPYKMALRDVMMADTDKGYKGLTTRLAGKTKSKLENPEELSGFGKWKRGLTEKDFAKAARKEATKDEKTMVDVVKDPARNLEHGIRDFIDLYLNGISEDELNLPEFGIGGWLEDNGGNLMKTALGAGLSIAGMPQVGLPMAMSAGSDMLFGGDEQSQFRNPSVSKTSQMYQLPARGGMNLQKQPMRSEFTGNDHEQGGIPLSGIGVEVEDGEIRTGDTIHSKQIKITPAMLNRYGKRTGLKKGDRGKSVADIVKRADKKFEKREGDKWNDQARKIVQAGYEEMSNELADIYQIAQEMSVGMPQGNQMAEGGMDLESIFGAADDLGNMPMVASAFGALNSFVTPPEKVDYQGADFAPTEVTPVRGNYDRIRRVYGNTRGRLNRLNPRGFQNNAAALASAEAESVGDMSSRVDEINAGNKNAASRLDSQTRSRTSMFNSQLSAKEAEANAANRGAKRSATEAYLSNFATQAGQKARDAKLYESQDRYMDMMEKHLQGLREIRTGPQQEEDLLFNDFYEDDYGATGVGDMRLRRFGGRLKKYRK